MTQEPSNPEEIPDLKDLFPPRILQEIEETFSDLAGFPVLLCDVSLVPLFHEPERPTFCRLVSASRPETCRSCIQTALGASPVIPGVRRCPAGPSFIVVPVDRGGIRYCVLLLGPVVTAPKDVERAETFASDHGLASAVFSELAAKLPVIESSRLEGAGRLLAGFARALGETLMGALSTRWQENLLKEKYWKLEEELIRSNEFQKSILQTVPAIISAVDLEGKYTSWPPFNEKYFGYTASETIGKMNGAELLADPSQAEEIRKALEEKEFFEGEVVLVKKDGTHAPNRFTVTKHCDRSGRHIGFIGIGVDISAQKEMERRLRLSEERTRALLETLPDIFYQTDLEGKITYANESAAKILGYSGPGDLIGKNLGQDLYVDPSEREVFLDRLKKEGGVLKGFEVQLWRGDGRKIWVSAHSRFRRDADGSIIGVEGVARDVTDRVEAEKRIVVQMEDLEKAYDNLKQAQTRLVLSEKMASLGTLIAGIAHEINNPMNFLHGNLAFLECKLGEIEERVSRGSEWVPEREVFDELKEALADAKRGATRVKEIVDNLRAFSRAGSKMRREKIQLEGCLMDSLRLVEPGFHNRVEVEKRIDGTPAVEGDRGLLSQVWMNLLLNAFQAVEGKGRVDVHAFREGEDAVVRIRDSGKGIPGEILEKIFEPFFSGKEDGVGLGLSLSYDIVRGHGGEITVESEEGKGTVFEVRLPAFVRPPENRMTAQERDGGSLGKAADVPFDAQGSD